MLRSGHPGLRYQGCFGLAPGNAERRKSFFFARIVGAHRCRVNPELGPTLHDILTGNNPTFRRQSGADIYIFA